MPVLNRAYSDCRWRRHALFSPGLVRFPLVPKRGVARPEVPTALLPSAHPARTSHDGEQLGGGRIMPADQVAAGEVNHADPGLGTHRGEATELEARAGAGDRPRHPGGETEDVHQREPERETGPEAPASKRKMFTSPG